MRLRWLEADWRHEDPSVWTFEVLARTRSLHRAVELEREWVTKLTPSLNKGPAGGGLRCFNPERRPPGYRGYRTGTSRPVAELLKPLRPGPKPQPRGGD